MIKKLTQEDKPMDKEIREKIALKRYQLISPVLAEPAQAQNEYFRKQADIDHEFPRYGLRRVRVSTMKAWLRKRRWGLAITHSILRVQMGGCWF
jgi:putative transposase